MKEWKLVRKLKDNENTNYKFWQQEHQKAIEMEIKILGKVLKYQCFLTAPIWSTATYNVSSDLLRLTTGGEKSGLKLWVRCWQDVYSRLSDENSGNYEKLKSALL